MIREDAEKRYVGAVALDEADACIGEVRQVFVEDETDKPKWASVRIELLGSEVLVPLDDAAWDREVLHLAVPGPTVLGAPRTTGADAPTLREQERLYTHYGIPTQRRPRSEAELLRMSGGDVCYSVRAEDRAFEERSLGAAMREAEESHPSTVSGHAMAADGQRLTAP